MDKKFKVSILDSLYIERKSLYENSLFFAPKIKGDVLDVGCGKKPYESLFFNSKTYVGLDHIKSKQDVNNKADYFYDGKKFPFKNNLFDSVVCTQVLEHVGDYNFFIKEINRVLKPNGILFLTAPFFWIEHEEPYDYTRFSSFGIFNMLKKNNFKILKYKKRTSPILALFQINILVLNEYFEKNIFGKVINKLLIIIFNLLAILFWNFNKNGKFYINNMVVAKKLM